MRQLAWLALLALSGCAATVSGTQAGGIIKNYTGSHSDLAKAEAYCAKLGKTARISTQSVWDETATFDCVAK